jgi:hypothetical protein
MPPKLYGGGRRGFPRPNRCDCGKIPYRDEAAALAAADTRSEDAGVPLHVYKCPGSSRWHLASRGFSPESLKTRPRILAWHLSVRRVITWDALMREFGFHPAERTNASRKLALTLRVFADLGLVNMDDPRPPYVTAVDFDGLLRVMQVGLQEYAESRGQSVTRQPREATPTVPGEDEPQP